MNEREIEVVLKALANKRRTAIVRMLKKRKKTSVGALADMLKVSFNATSRHLGLLYNAGLLDRQQDSLTVFYSLRAGIPKQLAGLISIL